MKTIKNCDSILHLSNPFDKLFSSMIRLSRVIYDKKCMEMQCGVVPH
jgi:hypothetical protein